MPHRTGKTSKRARKTPRRGSNSRQRPSQAIVVAAPNRKPWLLSPEEVTILKNNVCKGATDSELQYCLAVARRYELDPFQKQIWFVPRWDRQAEGSDGKKGATLYVPVVSIDGLQGQAAANHSDYGTFGEPEYGPMVEIKGADRKGRAYRFWAPEWCRMEAWKKGAARPSVAKVYWDEIYPDVSAAPMVRRMPRLMLAKCARAQLIRSAYPKKTGGLLIPEETHSREFQQITPEGRVYEISGTEVPQLEGMEAYELAVALAQSQTDSQVPFKERVAQAQESLGRMTPAQLEIVKQKVSGHGALEDAERGEVKSVERRNAGGVANASNVPPRSESISQPVDTAEGQGSTSVLADAAALLYFPDGDYWRVAVPEALQQEINAKHKDLFRPLWNTVAKPPGIVIDSKQLGRLLGECERRKLPIKARE